MAAQEDNVNTVVVGSAWTVGILATVGIVWALFGAVRAEITETENAVGAHAVTTPIREMVSDQTDLLHRSVGWVDKEKGIVRLPIDMAESAVLADLTRDPETATAPAPAAAPSAEGAAAGAEATPAPVGSGDAPAAGSAAPAGSAAAPPTGDAPAAGSAAPAGSATSAKPPKPLKAPKTK